MHAHQVAFFQDAGYSLEFASTITGISLGMSMAGRFLAGWVSEHIRHPHAILAGCLVMQAAGIGVLLFLESLGFWALTLFVSFFGLGYGGMIVLWPLIVGHDFGRQAFGAIAGVLGTLGLSIGGALGPVIAGVLYDNTGSLTGPFCPASVHFWRARGQRSWHRNHRRCRAVCGQVVTPRYTYKIDAAKLETLRTA